MYITPGRWDCVNVATDFTGHLRSLIPHEPSSLDFTLHSRRSDVSYGLVRATI
jgi:hypothetical protein